MDDHETRLKAAIVETLKTDAGVIEALTRDGQTTLPGARVVDLVNPKQEWPFIRYGFPISDRFSADGWFGKSITVTIHAFAKGPGQDGVARLKTAIINALDEDMRHERGLPLVTLGVGAGGLLGLSFASDQTIRDTPDASAYHGVVEFEAATAEVLAA